MSAARPGPPFLVQRGLLDTPLVLTCEHARHALPSPIRARRREREILASHWGWDIGAWDLTRRLSQDLGATTVAFRWSRLWIDVNRRIDDPTLVRREIEGLPLKWNLDLSTAEIERRVLAGHAPFHEEIDRQLLRRVIRGVRPLLLAVHSFTPIYDGRTRQFDIGVLYERNSDLAHRLGRSLRAAGFRVRYNQPYSGMAGMMYSADRHGRHHDLPCLELEVNQAMFARGVPAKLERAITLSLRELLGRLPGARG